MLYAVASLLAEHGKFKLGAMAGRRCLPAYRSSLLTEGFGAFISAVFQYDESVVFRALPGPSKLT